MTQPGGPGAAVADVADVAAIEQLKRRYVRSCDARDLDTLAALFAPDAVVRTGGGLLWSGQDQIRAGYGSTSTQPAGMHVVSNGLITIEGDQAQGTWYLQRYSLAVDHGGLIQLGIYRDAFVRRAGAWAIAELTLTTTWSRSVAGA